MFLGRNLCAEDPICDSLGNWQQLVAMTYARDTENIVLRGPVDKLKEVRRCQFIICTIPITFADFLPSSRSNFKHHDFHSEFCSLNNRLYYFSKALVYLVKDVWISRRITRTMQIRVPLLGPNSSLASSVRQGVFSNIAEQSTSVIALTPTPSGLDYSLVSGRQHALYIQILSLTAQYPIFHAP